MGPRWSWYLEPYRAEPYGYSAGELVRNKHSWPIFMPGHSLMGNVATLESSSVTCPVKPGSIQPAVDRLAASALLRDYDIRPVVVHPTKRADFSRHGYRAAHFDDAFARFLPHEPNIRTLKRGGGEKT